MTLNSGSRRRERQARKERQAAGVARSQAQNAERLASMTEAERTAEKDAGNLASANNQLDTDIKDLLSSSKDTRSELAQDFISQNLGDVQRIDPFGTQPKTQDQIDLERLIDAERERDRLKNRDKLLEAEFKAEKSGNQGDILAAKEDLLRLNQLEKGLSDQILAKNEQERTLFRDRERANAVETELGLKEGALDRQEASLGRQSAQLETDVLRQQGLTRRAGRLAGNQNQQAIAASQNQQAQSGFGSSSALTAQAASLRTQQGTKAGDILTGLGDLDRQATFARAQLSDARSDLGDSRVSANLARSELGLQQGALDDRASSISQSFNQNVGFLENTFDLGGDIFQTQANINSATAAANAEAARQSSGFQTAIAGIGVGAAGFTGAPIIGGLIVAKGVADFFDF